MRLFDVLTTFLGYFSWKKIKLKPSEILHQQSLFGLKSAIKGFGMNIYPFAYDTSFRFYWWLNFGSNLT